MPPDNCTMVVFGGTGDLTHRKLVPALYNLHLTGQLPEDFSLVGVGRTLKENAKYRAELAAS
ncbi:MAG: glucose-6-phosphate dehydrogenase, partial [Dethiobacteria bacterium]|nr:glucose-6-phosphate dehydrogenase [Dethiobacteria bacterium]